MTATTANGALTLADSGNSFVNLFSIIGSSRNTPEHTLELFKKCYGIDQLTALQIAFWVRDVRGGAGEREIFRRIILWLAQCDANTFDKIVASGMIEEVGRFDDYLPVMTSSDVRLLTKQKIAKKFLKILTRDAPNAPLLAKWLPRRGSSAAQIRNLMRLSPKQYRRLIVSKTQVVETPMCAQDWDSIELEKVPSLAMTRYQNAFKNHIPEKVESYKEALASGVVKAKASAVFPHDIVLASERVEDDAVLDAQWKALPDYIGDKSFMPIIDVSGSMEAPINGNFNSRLQAIHVAMGLGIYMAQRNKGLFKNHFYTFDTKPKLTELSQGSIGKVVADLKQAEWGGSTNFHAVFEDMLGRVKANPNSIMPDTLICVSDMEFDISSSTETNFQAIDKMFKEAGIKRPNLIFWNVAARMENHQVRFDQYGTAMISGYSPAVLKAILGNQSLEGIIDPMSVMMETINQPRYTPKFLKRESS